MYGILIEGKDIEGEPKPERIPGEILPVFKYLKEPENYMPILVNMMLDMIGCYQFPETCVVASCSAILGVYNDIRRGEGVNILKLVA